MSLMLVSGKQFICENCKKVVLIEYKDGAQMTQIGDDNVHKQMELSQQFGQINDNPNQDGYYLYDIGLCSDCFAAIEEDWSVKVKRGHEIYNLINEK